MFLLPTFLAIYALVDCIQTDESRVRGIQKPWWILLIVLIWIVGPVAWLIAGKEPAQRRNATWPGTGTAGFPGNERPRQVAPDDDPQFLSQLRRDNDDHERMLRKWEDDLRRREQELKGDDGSDGERGSGAK